MPTACGIETHAWNLLGLVSKFVATVPTACGIETVLVIKLSSLTYVKVATVPTACGIETKNSFTKY